MTAALAEQFGWSAHAPAPRRPFALVGHGTHTPMKLHTGPTDAGRHLALVPGFPAGYEFARALKHPHLYDERTLEAMHEDYLIQHRLTEWVCRCGQTNLTPDAEFSSATTCTSCGEA